MEYILNYYPKHTMQLIMVLEEHLDEMSDKQLSNYRKLCLRLQIEPKPLQCVKKDKKAYQSLGKKK